MAQELSKHAPATRPLGIELLCLSNPSAASLGNPFTALPEYMVDALQRSVLFLDLLRQRGNEEIEITSRPMATVLRFDHEELMSGRSLPRPINYSLLRILPSPGVATDRRKRPVVVVDPRAGQGPGIGGFKAESEIGDALNAGHPVYFIGFSATPAPGQQFLDVVEGQVKFFERVVELHPDAPRPFAIGNCQAGYQTLMVAMLRPDLFGPCLVAGSPMSYWQGVHGKNPMRYSGGLLGGSWLTAMTSDLGNGKFDGTGLILNFDVLNPANWLWGKQYEVYTHIDTDAERYLEFEKWWGDFIQLNGDELQFLVDNLFIGDKLTRNQLQSHDGVTFDVRNITSPIIVFTSSGDNISPPPQALGWILDLYRDVDDIRATGRTIVYSLNHEIGHLALFVSAKVGAKEDEEFVQMMDVIDCLPPGLYEMVISPRPTDVPSGGFVTGDWIARFEARSLDDIRALGRNSPEDDRAFAAVARLSELNLSIYRTFMQPLVRAIANQTSADLARALNPLRLSYTIFADQQPVDEGRTEASCRRGGGAQAGRGRQSASSRCRRRSRSRSLLPWIPIAWRATKWPNRCSSAFMARHSCRRSSASTTTARCGRSPALRPKSWRRGRPRRTHTRRSCKTGGFDEALTRAVLYVTAADRMVDQRCALALNVARQKLMHLSLAVFKMLVRDQFFVLQLEHERAVEALASMVPEADARKELLQQVHAIVGAGDRPLAAERDRLARLSQVLAVPIEKPVAPATSGRTAAARAPARPAAVSR